MRSSISDLPSILTTRPVALVLVELRHAVCRQWAEHVVRDESRLDLYNLSPMSMYRIMISVHGARKKRTDDSSNAYGSLLTTAHVDSSSTMEPLWSCPYTNPICMAWNVKIKINVEIRETQTLRPRDSAERIQKLKVWKQIKVIFLSFVPLRLHCVGLRCHYSS